MYCSTNPLVIMGLFYVHQTPSYNGAFYVQKIPYYYGTFLCTVVPYYYGTFLCTVQWRIQGGCSGCSSTPLS